MKVGSIATLSTNAGGAPSRELSKAYTKTAKRMAGMRTITASKTASETVSPSPNVSIKNSQATNTDSHIAATK